MKNCGDNYSMALNEVEDPIGESAYWNPPYLFMNLTVNERVSLDLFQSLLNTQEKVLAKPAPFPFVEIEIFANIKFSFLPERKLVFHLLGQYSSFNV